MPTEFKWSKNLQKELDKLNLFIRRVPTVKTLWLEEDIWDLLYASLKYPNKSYYDEGIPYDGKILKSISRYGIKGSE